MPGIHTSDIIHSPLTHLAKADIVNKDAEDVGSLAAIRFTNFSQICIDFLVLSDPLLAMQRFQEAILTAANKRSFLSVCSTGEQLCCQKYQ